MGLRGLLNTIRYNYFVSGMLVFVSKPLYRMGLMLVRFIEKKIKVNGFSVSYDGKRIVFPKNVGIGINSKIFWKGSQGFESLTSKAFISFFKQCDVFLDVGSNFGFYSVLAQKFNSNIRVFCFEPLPNIYQDNIVFHKTNKATNQTVLNVAMSDKEGTAKFFVPNVYNVESVITSATLEKDFFYNRTFQKKEISVTTSILDHFLEEQKESLKDRKIIVKIDVEGHECSVLKGAGHFLKLMRPYLIVEVDMTASNVSSLKELVLEHEYSMYCLTEMGYFLVNGEALSEFHGCINVMLLPNEKSQQKILISFEALGKVI